MKSVILQLFRRNPFSSQNTVESGGNLDVSSVSKVHEDFNFRILSYFDGMCIQKMENLVDSMLDTPCHQCVKACSYKRMSIHAERKKLLLFSEQDEPVELANDMHRENAEEPVSGQRNDCKTDKLDSPWLMNAPFIAFVSLRVLYETGTPLKRYTNLCEHINRILLSETHSILETNERVYYQLYRSLASQDVYMMLYASSWMSCEKVIRNLRIRLNIHSSGSAFFRPVQTYTIMGYTRKLEYEKENFENILKQRYDIDIQLQTIPGITPDEVKEKLVNEFKGCEIKTIVGNCDLVIQANVSMDEFIKLLDKGNLFGWYSPIAIKSDTHVAFDLHDSSMESIEAANAATSAYYAFIKQQEYWLRRQDIRCTNIERKLLHMNIPKVLIDNLLTAYKNCCQRLVRPIIWGAFKDIRDLTDRYFYLLEYEAELGTSDSRKLELVSSMDSMIDVISILTNDRLNLDYPTFEHVSNSVYEKGAYEELIQGLTRWIQKLENYAGIIEGDETKGLHLDRANHLNDRFHVCFILVPHLYGQTTSSLHFPSADHRKRVVVVNVSLREMAKLDEIIPTLAHEVGHYIGIVHREARWQLLIDTTIFIAVRHYIRYCSFCRYIRYDGMVDNEALKLVEIVSQAVEKENIKCQRFAEMDKKQISASICRCMQEAQNSTEWLILLTYYSGNGLLEEIPNQLEAWLEAEINNILDFMQTLIRELNADVFMVETTQMNFGEYIHVLESQKENYSEFVKSEEDDWLWLPLYVRIMCIADYMNDFEHSLEQIHNMLKEVTTEYDSKLARMIADKIENELLTEDMKSDISAPDRVLEIMWDCYDMFLTVYLRDLKAAHSDSEDHVRAMRDSLRKVYKRAISDGNVLDVIDQIYESEG